MFSIIVWACMGWTCCWIKRYGFIWTCRRDWLKERWLKVYIPLCLEDESTITILLWVQDLLLAVTILSLLPVMPKTGSSSRIFSFSKQQSRAGSKFIFWIIRIKYWSYKETTMNIIFSYLLVRLIIFLKEISTSH